VWAWFPVMATIRGILVKQFGGPEVLEYVRNISSPLKPTGRQVSIHNDNEVLKILVFKWLAEKL